MHNFPKYAVSLLKAWYGEHATRDNGWGYDWLPKAPSRPLWIPRRVSTHGTKRNCLGCSPHFRS